MLGWVPMEIFPIDEGVNNPIPERMEMRKNNKQYIAHLVDDYRRAACGKVRFYGTTFMTLNGTSITIDDIDEEPRPNSWHYYAVPCKECYKEWKKNDSSDAEA